MRHLQLYTALRTIVREGSIRKAAEFMTISPSALNRQVQGLEDELGFALFDRLPGGVRLSTAGEIYYRHFINHLAEMDRAAETVAALRGLRAGHVRIAVSPELATGFLPAVLERFRRDRPGVRVTICCTQPGGFTEPLTTGATDLALVVQPIYASGAETLASSALPVVAILPAPGPARGLRNEDFLSHDLILPLPGTGLREWIDLYFRRRRLDLLAAVECDAPLRPGEAGGRQSIQPRLLCDIDHGWLAAQKAVMADLPQAPKVQVALCQREGRALPPAAHRLAMQIADDLQRAEAAPALI